MSRSSDIMTAFLMGALAGGAVALLVAPDKGEVTRQRIRDGANNAYGRGKGWMRDTTGDLRDRVGDLASRTRDRVQDVSETARGQMGAVRGAIQEGKDAYRREVNKPMEGENPAQG